MSGVGMSLVCGFLWTGGLLYDRFTPGALGGGGGGPVAVGLWQWWTSTAVAGPAPCTSSHLSPTS